jgi:ABC-2 type transport system ATP-binding protein
MAKDTRPTAIKVQGVYKHFKLPHEQVNSLKRMFTQSLRKRQRGYEVQHALDDITIDVKEGEFFGIVGRNGSGKSTLLKILAGIYQPTKGAVHTQGKLVPFIELGVGFNPELTGRENVYLNGALLGFTRREIDAQYNDIVAFAELERFMDQKLKNYSSGMQVRLAFSVATRAKADILLVDEVLAVGDADFQRKCFNYFKQLKKEQKTVVFVSHDMNAVRDYCDRAVLIDKSKVVKMGNVADVASAYTKLFIKGGTGAGDESVNRTRWGDQKMAFTKVGIKPASVTRETETIEITADYEVHETVEHPVFGFTIKNGVGTGMLGTNTKIIEVKTPTYKKGQKGSITWQVPNILNDGDYFVDVSIIDRETADEFDWWENAAGFGVYRDVHTAYVVEPAVKAVIK